MRKVLIHTNLLPSGQSDIHWRPDYEAVVLEETETCVKVKTGIFSYQWLPKQGLHTRIEEINRK